MTNNVPESAQELARAYNEMVSQGWIAAQVLWEQTANFANSVSEAVQKEQAAAGKAWEQAINYSRERTEGMADLSRKVASGPVSTVNEEAQEMVDGIIASDQRFLESCAEYSLGVEQRRAQFASTLLSASADGVATNQKLAKSTIECCRAFMDWSFAVSRSTSTQAPF